MRLLVDSFKLLLRNGLCLVVLALPTMLFSQVEADTTGRKWHIPAGVRVQYAGNLGMISIGPNFSFLKDRLNTELSLGYIPKIEAEKPFFKAALKFIYEPNIVIRINKLELRPVNAGIVGAHNIGRRFGIYLDRSAYPPNYYWWNPAYRFGFVYQIRAFLPLQSNAIDGISFYLESSLWDLGIYSYFAYENYEYLSFWDINTLALGARVHF